MSDYTDVELPLIALVGAPNSGKTTLYNWLTNSKFKTVNYPGATVEISTGQSTQSLGYPCYVVDTPGTYSLYPKSADEAITREALTYPLPQGRVQKIILVVDSTQLERHLILAEQLKQAGFSYLIVCSMNDLLRKGKAEMNFSLLSQRYGVPVVLFDGMTGDGLSEIGQKLKQIKAYSQAEISLLKTDEEIQENLLKVRNDLKNVAKQMVIKKIQTELVYSTTHKLDQLLLNPITGPVFFFLIMGTLFSSIFWVAQPLMEFVDTIFSIAISAVEQMWPGKLWADFLGNGVLASFAAVFVFVPQIFILFFGIGIIEATGYLARAATLIDRPLAAMGLSGRSFVPLLSGFSCAVPAMMAARNISSSREKMIVHFIIPLMTCSARLPVYALLLSFLFLGEPSWKAGLAMAGLYFFALIVGAIAAGILHRLLKPARDSFFLMELPLYRLPKWKIMFAQALSRTKAYVFRAGPVIFTFAVIIWLGVNFPNYNEQDKGKKLQESYVAKVGQFIEPVFTPMGGDWRVGAGLLSAFAAREVFVSSLALVMNITEEGDSQIDQLLKSMKTATHRNGELLFTTSTICGLLVFFSIALQCMSTVAISFKESGSKKFAIKQLIILNLVAYVLSVIVVQGLRLLGVA